MILELMLAGGISYLARHAYLKRPDAPQEPDTRTKNSGHPQRPPSNPPSPLATTQTEQTQEVVTNNATSVAEPLGEKATNVAVSVAEPIRETLATRREEANGKPPRRVASALVMPPDDDGKPAEQSVALRMMTDQSLKISSVALGLGIASFFYPPLAVASLALVIYLTPELLRRTYVQVFEERRATVDLLVLGTLVVGLIVGGEAILAGSAIFAFMLSLSVFLANAAQRLTRYVRAGAKASLVDVFRQQPTAAWIVADGVEMEVPVESLQAGDIVVVNAGETIPIDGQITEGLASVDQHILTGESQPAEKQPGDQVFALTMVAAGKISVLVEKTGEETTAAEIGKILNQTINFKTEMQLWAEDLANKSVLPTLGVSALTLPFSPVVSWAVLLAHPKYKGTVATYISVLSYLDIASKNGILIKDGRVLELLNDVDTVVFDKTGTLTETQPHVGQVVSWSDFTEDEIVTFAAAAEYRQTHPVAIAILQEAEDRKLVVPEIEEAAYKVGFGLTVLLDGLTVRVGSLRFMEEEGLTRPPAAQVTKDAAQRQGHSLTLVAVDAQLIGALELEPTIRPEAKGIVDGLRQRGIKSTYIISGDDEAPTRKLAHDLGIDHYFAETLPEAKADLIEQLHQAGNTVCYVGDGINDAIALKKAAVSISLQGASSVAVDTAQVILVDESLVKLCDLFDLAAHFEQNMKTTFGVVLAPHVLSLIGILFLHFGLLPVIILCQLGLAAGVGNALLPRFQYEQPALPPIE